MTILTQENIPIQPAISSGRSKKTGQISWEDLIFLPAQLAKRPVDYFKEKINSAAVIGRKSKQPIKIDIPIVIGAMSFGAISKNAKLALAKASVLAGTAANTGEGGMLPEERKLAKFLIAQYSTARFGVDEKYLKTADAIEIKIGQGAKPGCYSPDHEIFTEEGFKNVRDIKVGEKIWSVNPKTNELELANAVKIYKYFYRGPMIQASSKSIDFLVTPDHNLPIKSRHSKGWKFIAAAEALNRFEVRTSKKFLWRSINKPPIKIRIPKILKTNWHQKEYISFPLKEWLQLSAWFISESFFSEDRRIEISQTKRANREEIKSLLSKMQIDFRERSTKIVVYSKQIGSFMAKEFGNRSEEKRVPRWIRELPQNYLELFLETIVKGDGTIRPHRKNAMTYFTSSKDLMNQIVEIAFKLGMAVAIRKYGNKFEIDIRSGKLWHGLNHQTKKKSWQTESTLSKINNYKGFVYCPELDKNHTLIIKRNGRVSLNGNSGGMLPAAKVTPEIAQIRKINMNEAAHSPAAHPDINSVKDLKNKIDWLRKITGGKPIILKLAGGHIEEDVKIAVSVEPDIIAIDGHEGATGAAPEVMLNQVGLPTMAALARARKTLDKLKAGPELWIGGGLKSGADAAKCLALGADLVFMSFALIKAMGCTECGLCHKGICQIGIATQDPKLTAKLDIDETAKKIAGFLLTETENIKMLAGAVGHNDIYKLNKSDLRAMSPFIAQITGAETI